VTDGRRARTIFLPLSGIQCTGGGAHQQPLTFFSWAFFLAQILTINQSFCNWQVRTKAFQLLYHKWYSNNNNNTEFFVFVSTHPSTWGKACSSCSSIWSSYLPGAAISIPRAHKMDGENMCSKIEQNKRLLQTESWI
jgi:hypothetical protein